MHKVFTVNFAGQYKIQLFEHENSCYLSFNIDFKLFTGAGLEDLL